MSHSGNLYLTFIIDFYCLFVCGFYLHDFILICLFLKAMPRGKPQWNRVTDSSAECELSCGVTSLVEGQDEDRRDLLIHLGRGPHCGRAISLLVVST